MERQRSRRGKLETVPEQFIDPAFEGVGSKRIAEAHSAEDAGDHTRVN